MAGTNLDGSDTQWDLKSIRAYEEGVAHRQADTAINNPITDNPWDGLGTPEETAWDQGWNDANTENGSNGAIDASSAFRNVVAPV